MGGRRAGKSPSQAWDNNIASEEWSGLGRVGEEEVESAGGLCAHAGLRHLGTCFREDA
jgi:hypothetical protein